MAGCPGVVAHDDGDRIAAELNRRGVPRLRSKKGLDACGIVTDGVEDEGGGSGGSLKHG